MCATTSSFLLLFFLLSLNFLYGFGFGDIGETVGEMRGLEGAQMMEHRLEDHAQLGVSGDLRPVKRS